MQDLRKYFVDSVMEWGKKNQRDFPWRLTHDPYRILIAEILLQRTKANQVVPVYQEFLQEYPTLSDLAFASVERIFEIIRPLGLAKRAGGIARMARQIQTEFEGEMPRQRERLLDIHWIGSYIANSILCHAYGINLPAYDANFARVIDRFFSLNLTKPKQKDKKGYSFACSLMPYAADNCRALNFSIIDFGDAVCKPRRPTHESCPLENRCKYRIES